MIKFYERKQKSCLQPEYIPVANSFSFTYPRIIAHTGMEIRESIVETTIHLVAKV